MKQTWTVYAAEGNEVIATRWTDEGPQGSGVVVKVFATVDEAIAVAGQMQADYDRLRRTINK